LKNSIEIEIADPHCTHPDEKSGRVQFSQRAAEDRNEICKLRDLNIELGK